MSNEKHETVTDIVAEKRREAEYIVESAKASAKAGETMSGTPYTEDELELAYDDARTIQAEADRLEAALKRELATTKESLVVGNAAKLREALITLRENLHVEKIDGCACGPTYIGPTVCAFTLIDAALAAPPRNCDKYTSLDEARNAYMAINEMPEGSRDEDMRQWLCDFHHWFFALAKEGGAK